MAAKSKGTARIVRRPGRPATAAMKGGKGKGKGKGKGC